MVVVGRAQRTVAMPSRFTLVAAMNPCPCGYRGHPRRPCLCPPPAVHRYRARISGPLLDRLDLQVEVPALDPAAFSTAPDPDWGTAALVTRVRSATRRQGQRGLGQNGGLADRALEQACAATPAVLRLLEDVLRRHQQSGRARVRLLRVGRTLADLDDREAVGTGDILQAAQLRGFAAQSSLLT